MEKDKSLEERVERELEAHSDHDVLGENTNLKRKFSHIETYPSRKIIQEKIIEASKSVQNKVVLDYGCGKGYEALLFLKNGSKKVHGIDISPVYIAKSIQLVKQSGFPDSRYSFQVMDAHKLLFEGGMFDLVVGNGILHHLDVDVALAEINRVLKPGGRALFFEPLADNPLLKLFRKLTPQARTIDEAPLSAEQIRNLSKEKNWKLNLAYCGIVEAPVAIFTSLIMPQHPENILLSVTDSFERWLNKKSILPSWNQYVLLDLEKVKLTNL